MNESGGISSYAQCMQTKGSSDNKRRGNVSKNGIGGHHSYRESGGRDSLPSIFPQGSGPRDVSEILGLSKNRSANGAQTTELLAVIEQQRKELQARTDSVNAIQRNFERLSEMYRSDRAELERLREENRQLKERDATNESEKKVFAAMQSELESLLKSYKESREARQQEKQMFDDSTKAMRQQMDEEKKSLQQLQDECVLLRGAAEESADKHRLAVSELSDSARHVLQFLAELKGCVKSLSVIDYTGSNSNNERLSGNSVEKNGLNRGTITAALSDAWDCVDALSIALRKAHVEIGKMTTEHMEQNKAAALKNFYLFENTMRSDIVQEELACREAITTMHNGDMHAISVRAESSLRCAAEEELALLRSELQERRSEQDAFFSTMRSDLNVANGRLQRTQGELAALQQRSETEAAAHQRSLLELQAQLRLEMQLFEGKFTADKSAVLQLFGSLLLAVREEQSTALRKLREQLGEERRQQEEHWRGRVARLEEETCKNGAAARDKFNKLLLDTARSQRESLVRLETSVREVILCASGAQWEALRRDECDQRRCRKMASANLLLRSAEAEEMTQRLRIVTDESTLSPVVECQRCLFALQLREGRVAAAAEARTAQRMSLEVVRARLNELRVQTADVSHCLREAMAEQSQLAHEAMRVVGRVEASHAGAAGALRQKELAVAAVFGGMRRLLAAEEASESAYSCGLCLRIYDRPVTCAPCGHTFCEECFLGHPQNKLRGTESARYCPECCLPACNMLVRVRVLEVLSGNFLFKQREIKELQHVMTTCKFLLPKADT